MGNTYYYAKDKGGTFADLEYDAWGMPQSPNKLVNNDHGNYVFATFTGHIYDTTLDIYFAEARFYDANNRIWMSVDSAKDGNNWYQYCNSNPTTYWDPTGMSWWDDFTDGLKEGWDTVTEAASDLGESISDAYNTAKEFVTTEVTSFVADPKGYFEELACDVTMYWNSNKNQIISTVVGVGATVLTTALATVTGGTAMLIIGAGTGAIQGGLDSYLNQRNSGFEVDWGSVGKEALKGGVVSGIAGGVGGKLANLAKPLNFCNKNTLQIAGDVTKHWAIGMAGDATTGMLTDYVSNRFDGKSPQEAFLTTMSNADDILIESAITSAAGTFVDSVKAPKCFVAGTMITTNHGLVAIENISIGDMVLAQNPDTGEIAYKKVLDTFCNETNVVMHVTVNDEIFTCTEEHPFYVENVGWVNASELRAGMIVWLADGTQAVIQDVWMEYLEEAVAVYNFKVDDFHTYFVGQKGVLVHNTECGDAKKTESGAAVDGAGAGIPSESGSDKVYFGQKSVSPDFSSQGIFKGESIQSVSDKLISGELTADSLPIEYIVRDDKMITMNNRSLTALSKANMKPTVLVDVTGDAVNEMKLTQRLIEMGGQPSESIFIRKTGETVHIPE